MILVSGISILLIMTTFSFWAPLISGVNKIILNGILLISLSLGISIIFFSKNIKKGKEHFMILLFLNIISLILTLGFIVGPILGIIGSIIGLKTKSE